jgi:hypothetical protein
MNDFASALTESFAVAPNRTTGLVIDTFDSWSDSTTSAVALTCGCRPKTAVRATFCSDGSVSPCRSVDHAPVRECVCRTAEHVAVIGSICRVASTVA